MKNERNEYVSIYVTKEVKKELELAKDNQSLKESIIKNFLKSETDWLTDELKEIDEATVKYSAKLIGIKESFSTVQNAYVEEIEQVVSKSYTTFNKIDSSIKSVSKNIDSVKSNFDSMLKRIDSIDFYKIERLISLVDKVNSMSEKELELLKKVLS